VVHRSDGSGTTYIFPDYLSTAVPSWKTSVGKGKEVKWPVGLGAKGNEGVSGQVKQTPGSIGYVELAYAKQPPGSAIRNKWSVVVASVAAAQPPPRELQPPPANTDCWLTLSPTGSGRVSDHPPGFGHHKKVQTRARGA
jgi:hypothetical protein